MKQTIFVLLALFVSYNAIAQIDTTRYPRERQQIRELMQNRKPDVQIDCKDFIAVGAKGDISFSHEAWQSVQSKEKVVFKSVRPVPGNEFIRIYDGNMAIVNFLINVRLEVDGREVNMKVRRLEVFHKTASGWCRVAGQGTEVDEKLFPVNAN
jgi:ketosteroid isomerase-like protein